MCRLVVILCTDDVVGNSRRHCQCAQVHTESFASRQNRRWSCGRTDEVCVGTTAGNIIVIVVIIFIIFIVITVTVTILSSSSSSSSYRMATNLENLEYSGISLNMENSGNSQQGILCSLREKLYDKQSIFSLSFKYLVRVSGDLLYCWSWCGMTLDEGHYYIYFLLQ